MTYIYANSRLTHLELPIKLSKKSVGLSEILKQMHQVCNRVLRGVAIDSKTRLVDLYAADASKRLEKRMLCPIHEVHRAGKQSGILSIGDRYGIARILSAGGYGEVFDFIEANDLTTNGSKVSSLSFRIDKAVWLTELLSRLSVSPDKTIYIGDASPDEPCFQQNMWEMHSVIMEGFYRFSQKLSFAAEWVDRFLQPHCNGLCK